MILSPIQKHGAAKTSAQALCNGGGSSRKYLKTLIKSTEHKMPRPSGNPAFLSRREHSGSGYDQNADFDHNHKTVIAIYTHSRDFTFQRSLPELLSLYTEFYPQEQAIQ